MTQGAVKVFFDGGCRPNPGAMEIAVVIAGVSHVRRDVGHGGSMDAEWAALIWAVELALAAGITECILVGDARAVIDQATRRTKAGGANAGHRARFDTLAARVPSLRLRHIKRTQNLAGIALARAHAR